MANDNLTLALDGRLPLDLFAEAIRDLDTLVRALSLEIAKPAEIAWTLADLQCTPEDRYVSGALVTSIGDAADVASVERVVRAYALVGKALEARTIVPYSPAVVTAATKLVSVLNGAITSMRFQTPEEDATVQAAGLMPALAPASLVANGAVEGTVETLSRRKGLRFTLYDTHFDRAVSCYLNTGQEDVVRSAWGNRAIVEGRITREPIAGRPVIIRDITAVEVIEHRPGGFKRARGAVPVPPSAPPPEEFVRRLRDA